MQFIFNPNATFVCSVCITNVKWNFADSKIKGNCNNRLVLTTPKIVNRSPISNSDCGVRFDSLQLQWKTEVISLPLTEPEELKMIFIFVSCWCFFYVISMPAKKRTIKLKEVQLKQLHWNKTFKSSSLKWVFLHQNCALWSTFHRPIVCCSKNVQYVDDWQYLILFSNH